MVPTALDLVRQVGKSRAETQVLPSADSSDVVLSDQFGLLDQAVDARRQRTSSTLRFGNLAAAPQGMKCWSLIPPSVA
jgi:hypothetical protein